MLVSRFVTVRGDAEDSEDADEIFKKDQNYEDLSTVTILHA